MSSSKNLGVQLPIPSASSVMLSLISDTVKKFPESFADFQIPKNSKDFSKNYTFILSNFEVMRASSEQHYEIAQFVLEEIQKKFRYISEEQEMSLQEAMQKEVDPLPIAILEYPYARQGEQQGFPLSLSYRDRIYQEQEEISSLMRFLQNTCSINKGASDALEWLAQYARSNNGKIDLTGHKFVLLGGSAELSPLIALLSAGAQVLTIQRSNIVLLTEKLGVFSGKLVYVPQGADLLISVPEIAATIREFAGIHKVHIGCLAYSGGKGREWRIAAAMDAIVENSLDLCESIFYYLSPSITAEVDSSIAQRSLKEYAKPYTLWQRSMYKLTGGKWYAKNIAERNGRTWSQSFAQFQGCSYAAANLFGKYYSAEVYGKTINASANVGPVTATSSMNTPSTRAAFREARRFNIDVFSAADTRAFLQLLMFHDILNEDRDKTKIFNQQVHGGLFSSPWQISGTMEEAAIVGNIKRFIPSYTRSKSVKYRYSQTAQATWIVPDSSATFEQCLRQFKGDLVDAVVGGPKKKPVSSMFLGKIDVIPKNSKKFFKLLSLINRWIPNFGILIRILANKQRVYGNLMTSLLFSQKQEDDILTIQVDKSGSLRSIAIYKSNRQNLEFSLKDTPGRICQILHFGRTLADGKRCMVIEYEYCNQTGVLRTVSPNQINSKKLKKMFCGKLEPHKIPNMSKDFFMNALGQSSVGSLTFPVNTGVLKQILELLKLPEIEVDYNRIAIYSLKFSGNSQIVECGDTISTEIHSCKTTQTDKGEMLFCELKISSENQFINNVAVELLVRGNFSEDKQQKLPFLNVKKSKQKKQGGRLPITMMNQQELVQFAEINQDHNPLHQIDGVAKAVGFPRIICPGFGVISQIEATIREYFSDIPLIEISGTFIRPCYPGKTYEIEYTLETEEDKAKIYHYQLINVSAGDKRLLVDGTFQLPK